ncbi:MAG TPA: ATP-binding cassette domain-containing protein [Longimicrobiales bacterium]|nr:ATP-binding cassette domain-containing protein [Longimicrobiales bacterium]
MSRAEEHARAIRETLRRDTRGRPASLVLNAPKIVELCDVWLSFETPVLRGVDLWAREGETLLVVGESGTGKSTLLKLILRLLTPDRGTVRVFGMEMPRLSFEQVLAVRRRIGMVFQYAALFDSLTVYENVAYPLRENTKLLEPDIRHIVRERLRFVDMNPDVVSNLLPGELSGGMRKRVGIARAIATDPELILYDEPTAGLDPLAVNTITRLIRKLQVELGVTSIVVTHDLRAGFRIASRVAMLRNGRILFDGSPEDMVAASDPYIEAFLRAS